MSSDDAPPPPTVRPCSRRIAAVVGLLLVALSAAVACWITRPAPPAAVDATAVNSPAKPWVNPHGYLGPDSCVACHAERVAEFRQTRHFQACLAPIVDAMPVGFEPGRGTYAPPDSPVRFEMSRQGDQFLQTAILATPRGEQRTTSPISLVYGLGAGTDEVYFTFRGNQLSELPMCWLHTRNEWGLAGFDRQGAGDFSRPTTPRCMECHNTWMEHIPGTSNEYLPEHQILGITCEVCHGPGQAHVAHHQAHPGDKTARSVVHPGKLPRERLLDLCAQCHSNALKHRGPAFSYRPGEPLDNHYKTLTTKHPEDDHVANQTTYLRQSKCFQQSEMTCITCHNPHRPTDPATRGTGHSACLECHQPADCGERDRLPVPVQDNCVGCHMPKGRKIQVAFETAAEPFYAPVPRWEHRIAVHPVARDEILLEWHRTQTDPASAAEVERLTTQLAEYWLSEADRRRNDHRLLATIDAWRQARQYRPGDATNRQLRAVIADYALTQFGLSQLLRHMDNQQFEAAMELAQRILAVKPDHAKAHGRLGTLYSLKGNLPEAEKHWRLVAQYDPDDAYGESMRGWQAYLDGRTEQALEAFRNAEAIEPWYDKIQHHLGLALAKLERWPEATEHFRKLLTINPQHVEGCLSLNIALRQQGQAGEALPFAEKAVALTRETSPDALLALADTYADLGRYADALQVADKLLQLTSQGHPQMLLQVRRRQAEWRTRAGRQTR